MRTKANNGGHQKPIDDSCKYLPSLYKEKIKKDKSFKETPTDKTSDYKVDRPIFKSDKNTAQEEDSLSIIQDLIEDEYEAIDGYEYAIEHIHNESIQNEFKTILAEEEKHIKMLNAIKEKLKI